MRSETQKGFAISGKLPTHKYLGSATPHAGKDRFLALVLRGCRCLQNCSGAEHVHQALHTCAAVQLCTCGFSNKLYGKLNSICITLHIILLTWYFRSEIGDSCHHGTAVQQNQPGNSWFKIQPETQGWADTAKTQLNQYSCCVCSCGWSTPVSRAVKLVRRFTENKRKKKKKPKPENTTQTPQGKRREFFILHCLKEPAFLRERTSQLSSWQHK